jgi:hypothetical protein
VFSVCFFLCFPQFFVCFVIVWIPFWFIFLFFPLSILSTLPSSSSHPHSQPLHFPSFSCAKVHCSPSQQLALPLLTHSFSWPSLSPPILPNLSPDCPFLLHTHYLMINPLYQLHKTLNPCNLWHSTLHYNNINSSKHTQDHKNQKLLNFFSHSHTPLPTTPFSVTYPTPQISIASLTNINPPTPTTYRYYHQGVFYTAYKLLVEYWTCELVITKLLWDLGQK